MGKKKGVKIAVIADTHYGSRNDHPSLLASTTKFMAEIVIPELEKRGIKKLVHLGDLFDRKKYVNIVTAKAALDSFVEPILSRGIDIHIMVGNHDCYFRNTNKVNSIRALYQEATLADRIGRGRMHLYENVTEIDLEGVKTIIVPWIPEDDNEALDLIAKSKARLCLGHLEIMGFDMYRGDPAKKGLSQSTFDHFDTVLSGHFHTRSKKTNVTYVGAACQYTWSDYGDERGFNILDMDDLSLEFIPNPFENFAKVLYDGSDASAKTVKNAALGQRFVKLIVTDGADVVKLADVVDTVESQGVIDLQVVDDHRHKDEIDIADVSAGVSETLDTLMNMINSKVDWRRKEAASVLATELYEEAASVTGDR